MTTNTLNGALRELNDALGQAFADDPANAVRAHAAVQPIIERLAAQPEAVASDVVAYITHSETEVTRVELTPAALCLGIGKHAVYTTPPPVAQDGGVTDRMVKAAVKARSDSFYTIPAHFNHEQTMEAAERAALTAALEARDDN